MGQRIAATRREFLWSGALAGGALSLGAAAACSEPPGITVARPLLVRTGEKTVAITHQPLEAPVLYFDKGLGRIYVAPEYRERAIKFMNASVTKEGVWAFAVGGDPPAKEEAKEEEYREWDPTKDPKKGDVRIIERECVNVTFTFNCVPVLGSNPPVWWKCNPLTYGQCVGTRVRLCWEVYKVVGMCTDYADKDCTRALGQSEAVDWFCLEE
ncbi:MAG TPA: hypothetical protein VD968_04365 [Pyrinomonadaceae bacterium]|nr:hypothetical protein [Pyrinomonadaceae bacterium]